MAADPSVIVNGNGNGNDSISPLPNLQRAYQVVVAATEDMGIGK
ncbi:dihydrofolate reductase-thymidylate synthase, partial [Trifolium medium]|nr:dihydrofolate reductase-thymidylate synthase [Trifolium medium]